MTYDPVVRPERDWYLGLCGRSVPRRIVFIEGAGELAVPSREPPADMVYIDGSHECRRTIDTFQAWLPHLAPRAVVAFHDWRNDDYPGVGEAIDQLGLDGQGVGELYVWHGP